MSATEREERVDRQSPHNLEAEASVLGGLLIAPERFPEIEGRVDENDFFSPAYASIFAAMQQLSRASQPLDILLLSEELKKAGQFDAVGGTSALSGLLDVVPTGANLEEHAGIVRQKAILRRLIASATEIVEKATSGQETAPALLDHAERTIFDISSAGVSREAEPLGNVLKQTWEKIEKFHNDQSTVTGLPTDYYDLDRLTSGLHGSELIIVAGRPSMGKSTFALNILRRAAVDHDAGVIFFSLEMSAENIARHLLCAHAGIDAQRLRTGQMRNEEWEHLVRSTDILSQTKIYIDDTPGISLAELRGKSRRLKARHRVDLVVVDYLQLVTASALAAQRSREQEISEISRGMKMLAKELDVPVICLSQLNRRAEGRADNRPILSDLRESGAIEQDADVVLLIHRPDYYDKEDHPGECEIIIAKQRNGPTDTVNLAFVKEKLRFENLSTGVRPPAEAGAGGDDEDEF